MSTDWIAQARARCEQATPGPWEPDATAVDDEFVVYGPRTTDQGKAFAHVIVETDWGTEADAEFIAAARTDLPRALDALERVRRALDDELANLADDGARLSHSVVRRIEAALALDADHEAQRREGSPA